MHLKRASKTIFCRSGPQLNRKWYFFFNLLFKQQDGRLYERELADAFALIDSKQIDTVIDDGIGWVLHSKQITFKNTDLAHMRYLHVWPTLLSFRCGWLSKAPVLERAHSLWKTSLALDC